MTDDGLWWAAGGVLAAALAGQVLRRASAPARGRYEIYESTTGFYDVLSPQGQLVGSESNWLHASTLATEHARHRGHSQVELDIVGPQGHVQDGPVFGVGSAAWWNDRTRRGIAHPDRWREQGWKIKDFPWYVSFTQGYNPPQRYSVPMATRKTAEAWEFEYREWGDRRRIYLSNVPSKSALILDPNLLLPDGSEPPDRPRRSLRDLRRRGSRAELSMLWDTYEGDVQLADCGWFVNYTSGGFRSSIPMLTPMQAQAWADKYRSWPGYHRVTVARRWGRNAYIGTPVTTMPGGGPLPDLPRRSLRDLRRKKR